MEDKDLQLLELAARTTSMMLRHDIPIRFICEQLDKISGQYLFSIPTNIAKILRKYNNFEQKEEEEEVKNSIENDVEDDIQFELGQGKFSKCPKCSKRAFIFNENCGKCLECNYSGCS